MFLKKMTESEYQNYLTIAVKAYALDKVQAGTWSEEEAFKLSKESFQRLLPDGINTKDQYIFSVYSSKEQRTIGMIWLNVTDEKAFIYDFMIDKEYRGKGYGRRTLELINQWASEKNVKEIGLHVFAHNQSAYCLYKKMGYLETDITMVKKV